MTQKDLEEWADQVADLLEEPPVRTRRGFRVHLDTYHERIVIVTHEYDGDVSMAERDEPGVLGIVSLPSSFTVGMP